MTVIWFKLIPGALSYTLSRNLTKVSPGVAFLCFLILKNNKLSQGWLNANNHCAGSAASRTFWTVAQFAGRSEPKLALLLQDLLISWP
ncbi:MAG: hypothetical protein HKN58_10335 [Xanthomonadales bacterium]|nr:hypothetical protein [Xanthomonadales bacterium]